MLWKCATWMRACVNWTVRDLKTYASAHITRHCSSTYVPLLIATRRSKHLQIRIVELTSWLRSLYAVLDFGHPFSSCVYLTLAFKITTWHQWSACHLLEGLLGLHRTTSCFRKPVLVVFGRSPYQVIRQTVAPERDGNLWDNYTDLTHHSASGPQIRAQNKETLQEEFKCLI